MNGRDRILTALRRGQPDTVPHMELWLNPAVAAQIVPGGTIEDVTEYLGNDGIGFYTVSMEKNEILDAAKGIIRDRWGVIKRDTGQTTPHPIGAPIKSEQDLKTYVPPDPDDPARFVALESMVKRFKGEKAIVGILEQPFMRVNELRGAEDHFTDLILNPDLILRLNEIVTEHHLRTVENFASIGADLACFGGDLATNQGPMVSPRHLMKFAIPPLTSLVQRAHDLGLPVILHSDGNIVPIIDMLLGTGADALHPIDPTAGLDIGVFKERFGDRVCLIGSIDCGPLLMWGTKEEIRQAVKENIRKAGQGGGLIAASSHSITAKVKPENYVEMVRAIREFGKYPLVA